MPSDVIGRPQFATMAKPAGSFESARFGATGSARWAAALVSSVAADMPQAAALGLRPETSAAPAGWWCLVLADGRLVDEVHEAGRERQRRAGALDDRHELDQHVLANQSELVRAGRGEVGVDLSSTRLCAPISFKRALEPSGQSFG